MKNIFLVGLAVLSMAVCKKETKSAVPEIAVIKKIAQHNVLSKGQIAAGWKLLFDGKSIKGWHKYGTDSIGKAWEINDQSIHLNVSDKKDWQDRKSVV